MIRRFRKALEPAKCKNVLTYELQMYFSFFVHHISFNVSISRKLQTHFMRIAGKYKILLIVQLKQAKTIYLPYVSIPDQSQERILFS